MEESAKYRSIADAAVLLDKKPRQIYRYLQDNPKIQRQRIGGKTFVHMPTLQDHEANVRPGRPRKT